MKRIGVGLSILGMVILLVGCGQQSSPTNHRNPATESSSSEPATGASTSNQTTDEKQQSNRQADALWNGTKDRQLEAFISSWAPTMHQSYQKYDGSNQLHVSVGGNYPNDLKREITPDGGSIGWAPSGKGPYDYNVVAIYNYDGTEPPLPNRITYFFAFHHGKPVALVDQSRDGDPRCHPTANVDVSSNFTRIADSH
ncbi:DUF4767 domain-containing protein [uncultured Limosilactobacillus sp.]|uniref:DUF4767 domain-containing protein n=1 Tax=uncultured Limosilactobacillus sp. TaxID=2837629 RepID=UPI0025E6AE89|nr:DUF4767 domain-containing protein [uncultured Limosilactobacillus sp.]